MEQDKQIKQARKFVFAGLIILAFMVLIGGFALGIGVTSSSYYSEFDRNFYFHDTLTEQMRKLDYDYLDEMEAAQYCGMEYAWPAWERLRKSGALDGTYAKFDAPAGEGDPVYVYSKAKLDAWMQAQFTQAEPATP